MNARYDMEDSINDNPELCQQIATDSEFAREVYSALCNNQFFHRDDSTCGWSITWR